MISGELSLPSAKSGRQSGKPQSQLDDSHRGQSDNWSQTEEHPRHLVEPVRGRREANLDSVFKAQSRPHPQQG